MSMKKGTKIIIALMITIGILLLSYPHVSNFIAEYQQHKLINNYLETLDSLNEERYVGLYKEALAYNEELYISTKTDEEVDKSSKQISIKKQDVK